MKQNKMNISTPKILIVDDRPENLEALEVILEDLDVVCIRALSGEEAVSKAAEEDFDLILMDVQMPGIDGFEAVKLIKKEEKNRFIPTLFQTAEAYDDQSVIEGFESGAADYITKPISE